MINYHTLEITDHFNNDGISWDHNPSNGNFDSWGKTFPAEELPNSSSLIEINNVNFLFPDKTDDSLNNFALNRQNIEVKPGIYNKIHILGASENGSYEDDLSIFYTGFVDNKKIQLNDFFYECGCYTNKLGIRCSHYHENEGDKYYYAEMLSSPVARTRPILWHQVINLQHFERLFAISFGDNPCIHIFCITLESS